MNEIRREQALRLEARVQHRLSGRIHDLHAVVRDDGLILQGRAHTYYAKQLAQHAVMEANSLAIRPTRLKC